ncbi:MAG: hypothetical protein PVJ21_02785 [Anaerolineales bacterium]|jgi:hypothetical protein
MDWNIITSSIIDFGGVLLGSLISILKANSPFRNGELAKYKQVKWPKATTHLYFTGIFDSVNPQNC